MEIKMLPNDQTKPQTHTQTEMTLKTDPTVNTQV